MTFAEKLAETAAIVEQRLETALKEEATTGTPERLLQAMQQAVLGGGKRFRPFLVVETTRLLGGPNQTAVDVAAALECIHCYSLVHDDLPAMDNDELRRGSPTVWKAYDDWTAILVGDSLQTLAFQILSTPTCHPDPSIRSELVLELARASGGGGMVGGQALDLVAERLKPEVRQTQIEIETLQQMKTGRLITFGLEAGAIIANATANQRRALKIFGDQIGLAFQLSDDLLDAEGDATIVGKAVAKDHDKGKATLVGLMGVDAAREELAKVEKDALAALSIFGDEADGLRQAAHFVVHRKS